MGKGDVAEKDDVLSEKLDNLAMKVADEYIDWLIHSEINEEKVYRMETISLNIL